MITKQNLISYIFQNYTQLRTCPTCGYESFEHTKCRNEDCKDNSVYGSPALLPTNKKAQEKLEERLDSLISSIIEERDKQWRKQLLELGFVVKRPPKPTESL